MAIHVIDNGSDMNNAVRRRATAPFFTTRPAGLGLRMHGGMARQSGGVRVLGSAPGGGTTVNMNVPPAPAAEPNSDSGGQPAAERLQRLAVLLVDDDSAVREATADMLRELDHAVTEADGFEAALAAAGQARPGLALLDYAMPGQNGVQVAAALRMRYPGLPILLVTGYADADALRKWQLQGGAVLAKPFTFAQLAAAIDDVVQAARPSPPDAEAGAAG